MATDFSDAFPLAGEYPESILARIVADLNAGIDPTDPLYADMQPGGFWDIITRAEILEKDRLYDRLLTEVPAAALPVLATGTWLDAWADVVGLLRKSAAQASGSVRFAGANGTAIPTGTQASTEAPTPDSDPISFQTTTPAVIGSVTSGLVDVPVLAVDAGSAGNVSANSVTLLDSALTAPVTVSNPAKITGGDDIESDERLQKRVLGKLRGTQGAGNVDYYVNILLGFPGIGFVTVQPNTPATGDVTISVTDVNNDPVSPLLLTGAQAALDPPGTGGGYGAGLGTIGATIIVTTPTALPVSVAVSIVPEPGFTVLGVGGTRPLDAAIRASIAGYIDSLVPGGYVLRNKVAAAISNVEGVANFSGLTLNGASTGDIAVTPGQVALLVAVAAA